MRNKRITVCALVLALLASLLVSCNVVEDTSDVSDSSALGSSTGDASTQTDAQTLSPVEAPADETLTATVVTSKHYSLTGADVYFLYYSLGEEIRASIESQEDSLILQGGTLPDFKYSMKQQYFQTGVSWHDILASNLNSQIEQYLFLANAADEEGTTLGEADLADVQKQADEYEIPSYMSYITKDTVLKCISLRTLASRQLTAAQNNLGITDADITAEYESNKKLYTTVDMRYYIINYDTSAEAAESGGTKLTQAQADELAKQLAAAEDEDSFVNILRDKFKRENPDMSESDIGSMLDSTSVKNGMYSEGEPIAEWAFDESRVPLETVILTDEEAGTMTVVMCISPLSPDEAGTIDVRHILFENSDTAEADAAAALAEYNAGEKTAEAFGALAEKYSADGGSKYNGGLYKNVAPGTMITEFNDWCFDTARVAGDTGVVQTYYGYHVMYFVGAGLPEYLASAAQSLENTRFNEAYDKYTTDYPVTVEEGLFDNMEV